MSYILAIDQGTTSSRAIVFDATLRPVSTARREITQSYPGEGRVEHDPEEIWQSVRDTCHQAVAQAGLVAADIAAIGITNQRETTVIWDRATGAPIAPAIVWQDRRTSDRCNALRAAGHEAEVTARTGLLLDPYFSATKIAWLLENIAGARARAAAGKLCFGTIDSYLVWRLTGGKVHATDATNASRTLLYDLRRGTWDDEMCDLFGVPHAILPDLRDCDADFGETALLGGSTSILAVAGDQHAATVGQACFEPGMMKATYGTGCFALLNTGANVVTSKTRLLSTLAYRLNGRSTFALEGSIFVAGAAVQWLRDGLGVLARAADSQAMAERADPAQNVTLIPAFTGLGAPYWNAECRGALFGMTRNTGPDELARAALESVGHQTADLIGAMRADGGDDLGRILRVDGGMCASDWAMQFLADILDARVDRPRVLETTARGVAWIAGQRAGICPGPAEFAQSWALDQSFHPAMPDRERATRRETWHRAISGALSFAAS